MHAKELLKRFDLDGHTILISPTDSKVRTTLHISIFYSGSEMVKNLRILFNFIEVSKY